VNVFSTQPIAEGVGVVGAEHELVTAYFGFQVFQRIDVVYQGVEIKIF